MTYIVTWKKGKIVINDTIDAIDQERAALRSMMNMENNGFNTSNWTSSVRQEK